MIIFARSRFLNFLTCHYCECMVGGVTCHSMEVRGHLFRGHLCTSLGMELRSLLSCLSGLVFIYF